MQGEILQQVHRAQHHSHQAWDKHLNSLKKRDARKQEERFICILPNRILTKTPLSPYPHPQVIHTSFQENIELQILSDFSFNNF